MSCIQWIKPIAPDSAKSDGHLIDPANPELPDFATAE
jgi:hypothetical protein